MGGADVVNYLLRRSIIRFNFFVVLSKLVLDALFEFFEKVNESKNKNAEENHAND